MGDNRCGRKIIIYDDFTVRLVIVTIIVSGVVTRLACSEVCWLALY